MVYIEWGNDMSKFSAIGEFWEFFKVRKKWLLMPIILLLLLLGVFIVVTTSSAIAPFIYALF